MSKILPFALAAVLFFVAFVNVISFVGLIRFNEIIYVLDRGAKPDVHQLQAAKNEVPSLLRDYFTCSDAQSRGGLALASALLALSDTQMVNGTSSPERYMLAQAADQRVRCSPLDGNAWLRKVVSNIRADVNSSDAAMFLAKSCGLAPAERWIIDYRLAIIRYMFEKNLKIELACLDDDISIMMKYYNPSSIAKFYAESSLSFREVLKREWAKLEQSRKISIARAVDQSGFVLDRSFWIEHVARDKS